LPALVLGDAYGGWTIVVVYATRHYHQETLQFLMVAPLLERSPPADVALSAFLHHPGGPVSCELGAVGMMADRTSKIISYLSKRRSSLYNLTPNTLAILMICGTAYLLQSAVVTTRNPSFQIIGYDAR